MFDIEQTAGENYIDEAMTGYTYRTMPEYNESLQSANKHEALVGHLRAAYIMGYLERIRESKG